MYFIILASLIAQLDAWRPARPVSSFHQSVDQRLTHSLTQSATHSVTQSAAHSVSQSLPQSVSTLRYLHVCILYIYIYIY